LREEDVADAEFYLAAFAGEFLLDAGIDSPEGFGVEIASPDGRGRVAP